MWRNITVKNFLSLFSSRGVYSVDKEHEYYREDNVDKSAIDYRHLDKYVDGSIGLDFFRGKSVLDVGAGEGVYSAWIADRGGAKRVVGLELTEHRIRRGYEQKLANLKFVCGDIFNIGSGLSNEQFDVVFINLVLHHLRFDLDRAIQIMGEHLRPGGEFVAFEPNSYSPVAVITHILHERSANEGFLLPCRVKAALSSAGFSEITIGYFWRDRQLAKNPILASSFWILAPKGVK
jgi:SAM-dependent methyltransferase